MIWDRYLLKEHGCEIYENIVYQDNQSAIKFENNGRRSSSKRKIYVNIIYYFINDRITKQEASMDFCPTLDVIWDYFVKALQGSQFRIFCNIIIGIHEDDIPFYNASVRVFLKELKI